MIQNDRLKIVNDIVNGSSIRFRESYIKNNHSDFYDMIVLLYSSLEDISFKEKIWLWVNDISTYYTCICGKRTKFNKNWNDGYKKYCSSKCSQSNPLTKEKRKNTVLNKYGVDNVSKSDIVKKKQEETNIIRYGTKSSFQNDEVKNKWKDTIKEKYGVDHYFKSDEFKVKSKKYYLEKYGVEHVWDVDEVKDKIKQTNLIRYGVETYLNTEHARNSIKSYNKSKAELEIMEWLDSIGVEYIPSCVDIIYPKSIDIYIPSFSIGIEFNGLYWHSEFFKDKKYHLNKTLLSKEKGVELIHVWEDDWKNRRDVIKSILLNRLNIISNKLYSRKCVIREVSPQDSSIFLNNNHIQGYTKSTISYGLFLNEEMVSIMSFGYRSINGKREYELIRFCNKLNTIVVGAASRLLKHFIKNNSGVDKLISYADISMFSGGLYEKLGFRFDGHSGVNYWWVVDGVRRHRFTYNKKKLVKLGYDPLMTEVEIMHSLNRFRVFGCGQDRYVLEL